MSRHGPPTGKPGHDEVKGNLRHLLVEAFGAELPAPRARRKTSPPQCTAAQYQMRSRIARATLPNPGRVAPEASGGVQVGN